MLAEERRQRLRQVFRQARGVGEQADGGLGAAGIGREIAAHGFDIVQDDAGMIEQAFARRGQLDAAAAALHQRQLPSAAPSPLIRALADASARWVRSAPPVMLRASAMTMNDCRSTRSIVWRVP